MNGYELQHCKSEVQSFNEITDWKKKFINAKSVAWYYDAIVFYYINAGEWNQQLRDMEEIVRMRIFDKDKELHIWRSNGELKGRLRVDAEGKETEYVLGQQVLNGTILNETENGIIATEENGTRYELPFPELKRSKNRIVLITRNYIGYNDIGQAGYVDSRFVNFKSI